MPASAIATLTSAKRRAFSAAVLTVPMVGLMVLIATSRTIWL